MGPRTSGQGSSVQDLGFIGLELDMYERCLLVVERVQGRVYGVSLNTRSKWL